MRNITESFEVMLQQLAIECIERTFTYKVGQPPVQFGLSFVNRTQYSKELTPIFSAAMVDELGETEQLASFLQFSADKH
jgi:hypothetical protein